MNSHLFIFHIKRFALIFSLMSVFPDAGAVSNAALVSSVIIPLLLNDDSTSVISPRPDIQVNGQNGPLTIPENTLVTLTLSLDPGSLAGQSVDVWVWADTPWGRHYFSPEKSWQISLPFRFTEGAAPNLSNLVILKDYPVPAGSYTVGFAIDDNRNGTMDGTYQDAIQVTSQRR